MNIASMDAIVDTLNMIYFTKNIGDIQLFRLKNKFTYLKTLLEKFFEESVAEEKEEVVYTCVVDAYYLFTNLIKNMIKHYSDYYDNSVFSDESFINDCNDVIKILRRYSQYDYHCPLINRDFFNDEEEIEEPSDCQYNDISMISITLKHIAKFIGEHAKNHPLSNGDEIKLQMYMNILREYVYTEPYNTTDRVCFGRSYKPEAKIIYIIAFNIFDNYVKKYKVKNTTITYFNDILTEFGYGLKGIKFRLINEEKGNK